MTPPASTPAAQAPAAKPAERPLNYLLWPYIRPYWAVLSVGVVSIAAASYFSILFSRCVAQIVDEIKSENAIMPLVQTLALLLLVVAAFEGVARYIMRMGMIGASRHIEFDMRHRFFGKLLGLSSTFYDVERTGDVMERASSDMEAVRMWLGPGIMNSFNTGIFLPFAIYEMARTNLLLTFAALSPFIVLAYGVKKFGQAIYQRSRAAQEQMGLLGANVQENFAGIRVVKAFRQEQTRLDSFREVNEELIRRNLAVSRMQSAFFPFMTGMGSVGFLMVVWVGSALIISGGTTIMGIQFGAPSEGQLLQFIILLGALVWPTIALGWSVNLYQRARASMNRIQRVFDAESMVTDPPNAVAPASFDASLELRNLTFAYPNPPSITSDHKKSSKEEREEAALTEKRRGQVSALRQAHESWDHLDEARPQTADGRPIILQDISVNLRPGQTLGVVGPIGSGKSTLARLLGRLYPVPDGTVLLGGHDVNRVPLGWLRSRVGYVFQETFLFSESIYDNIRYGCPEATREDVERVCRIASLHKDILEFPKGYDTMLGERGINLSGGQKQRAAIARALLYNPPILVLDDALSAVDTHTEAAILHALRESSGNRTLVIIAHRLSTLSDADHIIVLDQGRIVEQGTHSHLLSLGGLYARTWEDQQLAAAIEDATPSAHADQN
mgnify:CR=1 FL=1